MKRKRSDDREKELRLAVLRIECGRSHTKADKLSVVAVAREAGVSAALIHNHYPQIAEQIRTAAGRSSRVQRDAKHKELQVAVDRNRELRAEIARLGLLVRNLASENEMLINENRELKAMQVAANTRALPTNIQGSSKN